MNERIQKLYDQADKFAKENRTQTISGPGNNYFELFHEKFAELIVKECARVARATPAPNFHEHLKQQLGHTWDMSAVEAGREIVKHFGVS